VSGLDAARRPDSGDLAALRESLKRGADDPTWRLAVDVTLNAVAAARGVSVTPAPDARLREAVDAVATAAESWTGTPVPSFVLIKEVVKPLRAALAAPQPAAPAIDPRLRAFVQHRLGLYVLAAQKVGGNVDPMEVIRDRDPYLADAVAALAASPEREETD
jgi:hypothetical protein